MEAVVKLPPAVVSYGEGTVPQSPNGWEYRSDAEYEGRGAFCPQPPNRLLQKWEGKLLRKTSNRGSLLWAEDGGAGPSRFSGVLHKRRAYELWAGKLHGGLLHRYEFYDAGGGRTGFGYLLAGRF